MNQTRGTKRAFCPKGCGRMTNKGGKVCAYCEAGHPPPEAKPQLHRLEYLVECAVELKRRREQVESALTALQNNSPPRALIPLRTAEGS